MIIHDFDQNSPEWYDARMGIPTASAFNKLLTPARLQPAKSDYAFELAVQIICGVNPDPWLGNNATEHGHDSEDAAAKLYEVESGTIVKKVGFVTDDENTYGCSPDRLVGESGLLEIKSLKAEKILAIWWEHQQTGKFPSEYFLQCQGQMMITGREWCDLCLYHPSLGIKTIRTTPDLEVFEKLQEQIRAVSALRDSIVEAWTGF
jgi:predicted phage-related endonuclease